MNELLTLAVVPGIAWVALIFLRVPGVTLVLSILAGKLFAQELSQNFYDLCRNIIPITSSQAQLILLLLPVVLTVILTRSKVAKSKTAVNSLLLLFASVSLVLFALPYSGMSEKISSTGQDIIDSYQSYAVCATAGLALLFAWVPDLKPKSKKHK